MADLSSIGVVLVGIGVALMALGRLLQAFIRGSVDRKIDAKESEANEAAKNSNAAVDAYRELMRRYNERNDRK